MANTYKNIVITPNRDTGANVVPSIQFSGGDGTSNTDINVRAYTTQSGTLSFEGTAGQLFSITNDLTNVIFSVNDVSGIPSLEIDSNGKITMATFGGNVGIGTSFPRATLQANGTLFVTQNNASNMDVVGEIAEFAHNSNTYAQIHVRNASTGTRSSADLVATADIGTDTSEYIDLGINSSTYNDPTFSVAVAKDGYLYTSNGNLAIGTANTGKAIEFFTGGTLEINERMKIGLGVSIGTGAADPGANNLTVRGNLLLTGATSGLGYGTGSGGVITQTTSKATGVTLNKLVGAVTSNNAALASNTTVSFTVTNNLVASSDVVVVNRLSGGTAGAYVIWCTTVSTGSFAISMRNLTNATLTEVVVMGYAVIKAVQA